MQAMGIMDVASARWLSPPATFRVDRRNPGSYARGDEARQLLQSGLRAAAAVDRTRFDVFDWTPIIYRGFASDWVFGMARMTDVRDADSGGAGILRQDELAHRSGWPFRAMESMVRDEVAISDSTNRLTALRTSMDGVFSGSIAKLSNQDRALYRPRRIIWHGFALDIVLFAAVWFLALFGVAGACAGARRILRSARGCCPSCGYDLRGHKVNSPQPNPLPEGERAWAGCPECGWNRSEEKARRSKNGGAN
jgi:hypothetical protein